MPKRGVWVLAILLVPVCAAILPMFTTGYPITHSTQFNLSWAFQFQRQFFAGQLYPRWLEYSNFGFGNATFAFYPPLCMYATLPFRALGASLPGSLVASMMLAIGLFGLGLYRYARCFYPRAIAGGVAAVGIFAPYFLVNVYLRGAIGEVWAMVNLPWVLWATHRLSERPTRSGRMLTLALCYGLLCLSHLPTLLVFTLVWAPLPWIIGRPESYWRGVLACYGSAGLAFGWTAVYLIPAALDQRHVQIESINLSAEYEPQHRLIVDGLLNFAPQFADHWFDRGLVPLWGLALVVLLLADWSLGRRNFRDPAIRPVWYWVGALGVVLLMMTDLLAPLYAAVGPLRRIQFSWRWMSVMALLVPMLLGHLADRWCRSGEEPAVGRAVSPVLLAVVLVASIGQGWRVTRQAQSDAATVNRFAELADRKQYPVEPVQGPGEAFLYWHWIYPDGLGLVDVPEYRAQGVGLAMPPERSFPLLAWQDGSEEGLVLERWGYGIREFAANNDGDGSSSVTLRTFYYPAWQATLDGAPAAVEKSLEGLLQVAVPPGEHRLRVRYAGTPMDRVGRFVSLLTFGAVGLAAAIMGWRRRSRRSPQG